MIEVELIALVVVILAVFGLGVLTGAAMERKYGEEDYKS